MKLRKIGLHRIESDGWSVDTSAFWFARYKDATVEAEIYLEHAGTLFSPCSTGFSTMIVTPSPHAEPGVITDRAEIERRVSAALKLLRIRFRAV